MKKVTFVLPGPGTLPIGGFKVVYEYANHLAQRGYHVTIIEPSALGRRTAPPGTLRAHSRFLFHSLGHRFGPAAWFNLSPDVRLRGVPNLKAKYLPEADVIFATAWQTAEWVAGYPPEKGRKCYLIQHLETWSGPEDQVLETWKMPLEKVVISRWLLDVAAGLGEGAEYIPNGLDLAAFGVDRDNNARDPTRVAMLLHEAAWKGSQDGLKAIALARRRVRGLSADLFGTHEAEGLPSWVRYHRCPPQTQLRALYNAASIFIAPSWSEGWPLPPAEAMLCGAAVAATDIGGHSEYMINEVSALLSPSNAPEALAQNIERLALDPELRERIADAGTRSIRQFTWGRATDHMEQFINQA